MQQLNKERNKIANIIEHKTEHIFCVISVMK